MASVSGATVANSETTYNAGVGLNFPNMSGGSNGLQAFAFATRAPSAATVNGQLSTHRNVAAWLVGASATCGLGSLGANYAGTGLKTYSASYSFGQTSSRSLSLGLGLGLLGMTSYNGDFSSLNFSVTSGTTTLFTNTLTTVVSAQTHFFDHAISLGNFSVGAHNVAINCSLTAGSAQGADISYLLSSLALLPLGAVAAARAGAAAAAPAARGMETDQFHWSGDAVLALKRTNLR